MKKMKPHEPQMCTYCPDKAHWRSQKVDKGRYACDAHRKDLQEYEADNRRPVDDGYMTEADYQTWGRL